MRLAMYTSHVKLHEESADIGHLAKMIESNDMHHRKKAMQLLEGGLFYEVCSRGNGLYTKVKELSVVETIKGPRLAQSDVFLDGRIPDGGYRGRAYRMSTPEILEFVPGKLDVVSVFTGENLAIYFEIMSGIEWAKLEQFKRIF